MEFISLQTFLKLFHKKGEQQYTVNKMLECMTVKVGTNVRPLTQYMTDKDITRETVQELCNNINPEIGKVIIATRDSDFKLISRSLEEEYGFGVVGDAQELNRRVLQKKF